MPWDELSAYVIGYFMADGNIFTEGRRIRYVSKDFYHLCKVQEWFGRGGSICRQSPGSTVYQFTFSYPELWEWLVDIGVTSDKTNTGMVWIEHGANQRHFIRGFTDGDGCIYDGRTCYINKTGERREYFNPTINWDAAVASIDFLNRIKLHYGLVNKLVSNTRVDRDCEMWRLSCGGQRGLEIMQDLYTGCNYYLDRKFQLANYIMYRGSL
jgi:hypothetical protein